MQQIELFSQSESIQRCGLSIELVRNFITPAKTEELLARLIEESNWQQPRVQVYGRWHRTPRLVCFHASDELSYSYSSTQHQARAMTPLLQSLRSLVSRASDARFNAVLLNYYRDGQDTIGWHADDEAELGEQPVIASLSLGATRDMHFKAKSGTKERIKLSLPTGSLLIMRGFTQRDWLHHLPRRATCREPRVNLTFRWITRQYSES